MFEKSINLGLPMHSVHADLNQNLCCKFCAIRSTMLFHDSVCYWTFSLILILLWIHNYVMTCKLYTGSHKCIEMSCCCNYYDPSKLSVSVSLCLSVYKILVSVKALAGLLITSSYSSSYICHWSGRKHCGKRRKWWLPAFSPFARMFSKFFFLTICKTLDCVVKS